VFSLAPNIFTRPYCSKSTFFPQSSTKYQSFCIHKSGSEPLEAKSPITYAPTPILNLVLFFLFPGTAVHSVPCFPIIPMPKRSSKQKPAVDISEVSLESLPDDVLTCILRKLDLCSLLSLSATARALRELPKRLGAITELRVEEGNLSFNETAGHQVRESPRDRCG
jgi:hypothetical protein